MPTDLLTGGDFVQNVVGSTNVGALPLISKLGKVRNSKSFLMLIFEANTFKILFRDWDFPIIPLGAPPPPSKSDKTLYTGIYLPTLGGSPRYIIGQTQFTM